MNKQTIINKNHHKHTIFKLNSSHNIEINGAKILCFNFVYISARAVINVDKI